MKKFSALFLFLCSSIVFTFAEPFVLGYCSNTISNGIGASEGANDFKTVSAAIQVNDTILSALNGDSITQLQIGLSNTNVTRVTNMSVFITDNLTKTLNGEYLYLQDIKNASGLKLAGWNTIVLDSAFAITQKELFIGYIIRSDGSPVGCDGSANADARACWAKSASSAASKEWSSYSNSGYGNFCIRALGETGADLGYNVTLESVSSVGYTRPGTPFYVTGSVISHTVKAITSFDVACCIGNDTLKLQHFDKNINYGVSEPFQVTGLICTDLGKQHISVSVINVNGVDEESDMSDNTRTVEVDITNYCADRVLLLEHFTTEACPNCPNASKVLHRVLSDIPDDRVAWAAHHIGYYTDSYTLEESEVMQCFYSFSSSSTTYAPAIMIDRTAMTDYDLTDGYGGGQPSI